MSSGQCVDLIWIRRDIQLFILSLHVYFVCRCAVYFSVNTDQKISNDDTYNRSTYNPQTQRSYNGSTVQCHSHPSFLLFWAQSSIILPAALWHWKVRKAILEKVDFCVSFPDPLNTDALGYTLGWCGPPINPKHWYLTTGHWYSTISYLTNCTFKDGNVLSPIQRKKKSLHGPLKFSKAYNLYVAVCPAL